MNFESNILHYRPCIKCNNSLAKIGTNYCKKCHVKPIKSRKNAVIRDSSSRKIYYYKFQNRDTKARLLLKSTELGIGYPLCIEPSNLNSRSLQTIGNNTRFLMPTWEQFRSLKEFVSCIIKSDHISYSYFILSCNAMIQNLPKFQQFVQSRINELPSKLFQVFSLPYPLTNALQLLCQTSFWDDLISIYFNNFHPMCPLFSILSFDKKTASPTLLSAIYFCAFVFSKNKPREVYDYMETLATHNIKKIVKKTTIDNLRALSIHSFIALLDGKLALAKSLHAHLTRMSYLLGIHLECKKLSPIDTYNRKLLFNVVRAVNLGFSGTQNFSHRYLTEYGKDELNLYNPKLQLPTPNSPIYFNNQAENELYSVCVAIYSRFYETATRTTHVPSYISLKENTFNNIWRIKIDKLKIIFESAIQELEELKVEFFEFEAKVSQFQTQVKISHYDSIIYLYELLKHKNKHLKPEEITAILEYCHNLYQVIITVKNQNLYFQFYTHIIGLNYLNVYSKCSESEKIATKQRLKELIQFIKEKFYSYYSLNYLLLKTGYDSLDDR